MVQGELMDQFKSANNTENHDILIMSCQVYVYVLILSIIEKNQRIIIGLMRIIGTCFKKNNG